MTDLILRSLNSIAERNVPRIMQAASRFVVTFVMPFRLCIRVNGVILNAAPTSGTHGAGMSVQVQR